jgi:hypothetical protein
MDAETWISIASAVVATAALGLAVWEGMANRRHNRLSVCPRLRVDFDVHPVSRHVSITLVNAGLGPAIFDSYRPMLDGEQAVGHPHLESVARHLGIRGQLRFATITKGDILTHGSSRELLCVLPKVFDEVPDQDYDAAFRRLGVRVHYHSMYDEPDDYEAHGRQFMDEGGFPVPPPGKVAAPPMAGTHAASEPAGQSTA